MSHCIMLPLYSTFPAGTVTLEVPSLPCPLSDVVEENLENAELMAVVERTCNEWFSRLSLALDTEMSREAAGNGPLPEIEFWKERHANLSALDEQLKRSKVQEIVQVGSRDRTGKFKRKFRSV